MNQQAQARGSPKDESRAHGDQQNSAAGSPPAKHGFPVTRFNIVQRQRGVQARRAARRVPCPNHRRGDSQDKCDGALIEMQPGRRGRGHNSVDSRDHASHHPVGRGREKETSRDSHERTDHPHQKRFA